MNVVVLHDHIPPDARADELDCLVQAEAIAGALSELRHNPRLMPCPLNLAAVADELTRNRPDLVFNIVESIAGHGRLLYLAPALLDALQIPYAGAGTEAMFLTSSKVLAKKALHAHRIATPGWVTLHDFEMGNFRSQDSAPAYPGRCIIKSVWEEASFGIDESAIVHVPDAAELHRNLVRRQAQLQREVFAEAYIDGREFNLSVLDTPKGPVVLPPAEIDFGDFPPEKPRIVDYAAKWDSTSFAYHHTPRRFEFADSDQGLIEKLMLLARRCWDVFELKGYARVDFRVDANGQPWVLEINANPCISPDAGFVAAAQQAGWSFVEVIDSIVGSANVKSR